ncbi:MAG: hypothetical protein U9Q67_03950 [Patescibacteria group bacterium]|nr:hypothetical protein [Patescibacteria group bacterium]
MYETLDDNPPLKDLNLLTTREEHDLLIAVRDNMRAGVDTERPEAYYYSYTRFPVETDYSEEHMTLSESDSEPLSGVLIQIGQFVENSSLDNAVSVAQEQESGHFVDPRGSLTIVEQGDIHRLNMVNMTLPDMFDTHRSPIKSVYCSKTKKGEARDKKFQVGKDGIHVHYGQCDRFVFVDGHWEIVLQDLRPDSPTYGKRVCISFDAGPGHQLAMVIPPGIAHTVGVFRGEEGTSAWLVNFPTRGYAEVPPNLQSDFPAEDLISAKVAVRAMEARLDPTRIYSEKGTGFSWMTYARWLEMHQQDEELEALQGRHHILMPGGTGGLLGSALKEALAGKEEYAIEAASRRQSIEATANTLTFPWDLTHASIAEIKAWILASGAEYIVLTAAWTDVAPGIALSAFFNEYSEQLNTSNILRNDPITQINVRLAIKLARAIFELPEDERPMLVMPTTTFKYFRNTFKHNHYTDSKRLAEAMAWFIIPHNIVTFSFGYPYTTEHPQSPDAKPMTLHKLINRIVRAIEDKGEQVKAFTDDAVDPTNMTNVVNEILSVIADEQISDYPRGWLSTHALCEIIVEVYADITGENFEELKTKAIIATQGEYYKPTVQQLLGKNFEQNPVYLWMCKVARQVNYEQGEDILSIPDVLSTVVNYSAAYPQISQIKIDLEMQAQYEENLKSDIHTIMTRILQAQSS